MSDQSVTRDPEIIEEYQPTWACRFHPTDWWHEVGCPHMEWTKEQLLEALIGKKKSFDRVTLPTIRELTTDAASHAEIIKAADAMEWWLESALMQLSPDYGKTASYAQARAALAQYAAAKKGGDAK